MIFLKWFSFNLVIALILGYLFISCGHSSLEPYPSCEVHLS